MDSYELFQQDIQKAVDSFKQIPRDEVIRVVSHFDADGISAASLMVKCLNNDNRKYSLSIVPQVKIETVEELSREPYNYFVFTDLGSGVLNALEKNFSDKKVLILDHHEPEKLEVTDNIWFVNPHKFGIDGGKEISGAGVVYMFAETLDPEMKKFAHVAIIGAMGDMQEKNGFEPLNNKILETAVSEGKLKVIRGLRLFGAQTRPLHKVLEYCTDPYIPGVSGSESGAIQFLMAMGIDPKNGKGWKKITHLTDTEMQALVTGVIMQRLGEDNPEDVLGNVYILREEKEESPTKDAKEFATLLNACGRLEKASLGIGACLGDEKIKKRAIYLMAEYKKEIVSSLKWFDANKESDSIVKEDGFLIINAQSNVRATIIGTLASILSKSNDVDSKFIMSLAQAIDGTTKVSLRMTDLAHKGIDLKEIMSEIVQELPECESGGHAHAAGAVMPQHMESVFIEKAKLVLGRKSMEEFV